MNNSSHLNKLTGEPLCLSTSPPLKFFKVLVLCLIMLCGVIGNLIVIAILFKHKRMRSTTNKFIWNMAVSDLLLVISGLPIDIASLIADSVQWQIGGGFGLALCKLLPFLADVSVAVSIQTLVMVAFDRFYAIKFPMRKPLITNRVCSVTIVIIWFIAMALYSPIFYTAKLKQFADKLFCTMDWGPEFDNTTAQSRHFVSIFVLLYAIPLLLIMFAYFAIYIELRRQTRTNGYSRCELERKVRGKENSKILKLIITVVLLFSLSWLPLHIYAFLKYFSKKQTLTCSMEILQVILVFTKNSGCAGNPFVYFIFLEKYRQGLRNLFQLVFKSKLEKQGRDLTVTSSIAVKQQQNEELELMPIDENGRSA